MYQTFKLHHFRLKFPIEASSQSLVHACKGVELLALACGYVGCHTTRYQYQLHDLRRLHCAIFLFAP